MKGVIQTVSHLQCSFTYLNYTTQNEQIKHKLKK